MARYGMAIDMTRCSGCQTCVVACQMHHALRPGVAWAKVDMVERGRWPEADLALFPHACLHCDDPLCVRACPTGASHKRDDGIVSVAYDLCIGCGVCMTACPYGARTINDEPAWFFGAAQPAPYEADNGRVGVAEKCTFCAERLEEDKEPACVAACIGAVRAFGDLDDPDSDVNRMIRETGAKNIPGTAVYYATGKPDFDLAEQFAQTAYTPAAHRDEDKKPEPNPPVLAGAAAVVAGAATGIGISAAHTRKKRAANKDAG